MYFPEDMTFQYFFFDTYPGYFLQTIPVALIAGLVYAAYQSRHGWRVSAAEKICSTLFVCYLAGLISLTLAFHLVSDIWYFLLYHGPSGTHHRWFTFDYNLIPDFFHYWGGENLWNILMYLPFGVLFPLARAERTWRQTVTAGVLTSLAIELIQPIFGRSFDSNDIILNVLGVLISASAFFVLRASIRKQ